MSCVHRPIRTLTFTTLYPNAARPVHGIFVENRLRHLLSSGDVETRVIAPVPWFPFTARLFGGYAAFAQAPKEEERFGIPIWHPRYPVVPKLGMTIAPSLLYAFSRRSIGNVIRAGFQFDIIDAHYFYPDGIAAVLLGKHFRKPVVITTRGSDVNIIARHALPKRMIRWAATHANALITVSSALKGALVNLGAAPGGIVVLRNGVDLNLFQPLHQQSLRDKLGLQPPVILSVGNLIPLKGHHLVIRAMTQLPQATLAIVGKGGEESTLRRLAHDLGLGDRVRLLGAFVHSDMPELYSVADVLVLASSHEGWPNVVLESLACGTPVVATDVGGVPEIIAAPEAGTVLHERTPEAIAHAVQTILRAPPARAATRAYAAHYGWDATTQGQIALFDRILNSTASETCAITDGPRSTRKH